QSALQHAILVDHAVKEERQHHSDEECRGEPRAERNATRQHDQDAGAITGMPEVRIWPTCDHVLSSVGLNTHDGRKDARASPKRPTHSLRPQAVVQGLAATAAHY